MSEFRPPRIALLTSSSLPGVSDLIAGSGRGSVYEIAGAISTETHVEQRDVIDDAGVPLALNPIRQFHDERRLPFRNLQARAEYDAGTADLLRRLDADFVIAAGYRYIMTETLLSAFPQRIIAVHDGDLTIRDTEGRRPFAGLHPVREAILSGADETRSSASLVTADVGEGALFLLSAPYRIAQLAIDARRCGDVDSLLAYARLHRRWMRRAAWGGMLTRIVEILAAGTMQVVDDIVWIDGVPGPCRMGDAPAMCQERQATISRGVPASCPWISR